MLKNIIILLILLILVSCQTNNETTKDNFPQISGIYPHLAMYNNEGECGTGAIVLWSDRLWVITYGPHLPYGSSDKLYEITPGLEQIVRDESIGGTPANRMIHKESKQLFIGPYIIDKNRNIKVIPYSTMQGRHTGNARHLTDPVNKIYYGTMEEGFYDVDVNTLEVNTLYNDGNAQKWETDNTNSNKNLALLPGAHGKGLYSGQGVMVFSNNGEPGSKASEQFDIEAGVLAEWNGKDWKVIRRNQFVEVTGPGGIYGNNNPVKDPIWATGWDHKSILLGVRNPQSGWSFYRLPKASHTYDGAHGWNTEWPRIRNIGTVNNPDYLMTMHGLFWKFPNTFSTENSAGIRPRSAYLKVIGDFTRWNDKLIFGCDDSAQKEFLNKRKQKGNIDGPGQSNSNLWFTSIKKLDQLGPNTASGAVWIDEKIKKGEHSEPFLFSGWEKRCAWINNRGQSITDFTFEIDKNGTGEYKKLKTITLLPGEYKFTGFNKKECGEWIRVSVNKPTIATVSFNYSDNDLRHTSPSNIFKGIANIEKNDALGGLLYGLGNNRRTLGVSAIKFKNNKSYESGYYELDEKLNLSLKKDDKTNNFIKEKFSIPQKVVKIDKSSVLIIDDKGRRWRLPLGNKNYKKLTDQALLRLCREVATERDLFNVCGTFYELPAENADGFAKLRPISSHNFRIHDYASYRGLLILTGINPHAKKNEHIIFSDDRKAAVWAGAIDDLWEMGKPIGHGGPWFDTNVKAGIPSDPYLIGFYDQRSLKISHKAKSAVSFIIEVDPTGNGNWMTYKTVSIDSGEKYSYKFPANFQARWVRFTTNKNCEATTLLYYK